jgi:hypothetical protein
LIATTENFIYRIARDILSTAMRFYFFKQMTDGHKKSLRLFDVTPEKLKRELDEGSKKQQEQNKSTSDTPSQEPDEGISDDLKLYKMHKSEGVNSVALKSDNKNDITWDDVQRLLGKDNAIEIGKSGNEVIYISKKDLEKSGLDINKIKVDYIKNKLNMNDLNSKENKVSNDSSKGDDTHEGNNGNGKGSTGISVSGREKQGSEESPVSNQGNNGRNSEEIESRADERGNGKDNVGELGLYIQSGHEKNTGRNKGRNESDNRIQDETRAQNNINLDGLDGLDDLLSLVEKLSNTKRKNTQNDQRINNEIVKLIHFLVPDRDGKLVGNEELLRRIIDSDFGDLSSASRNKLKEWLSKVDTVIGLIGNKKNLAGFNAKFANLIGITNVHLWHLIKDSIYNDTVIHEMLHGIVEAVFGVSIRKVAGKKVLIKMIIDNNSNFAS